MATKNDTGFTLSNAIALEAELSAEEEAEENELGPPLELHTLSRYLDWRTPQLSKEEINIKLWRLAVIIWEYLPVSGPIDYEINFAQSRKYNSCANEVMPVTCTSSQTGDILYSYIVQADNRRDKLSHIVLLPSINHIYEQGKNQIVFQSKSSNETNNNESKNNDTNQQEGCKHWEVKDMGVTHLAFDKDEHIYFTNGEKVYKIGYDTEIMGEYSNTYSPIWSPESDTFHITSLWRQADVVYFTVQDWNKEEDIVLYRIKKAGTDAFGRKDSTGSGVYRARTPTDSNLPSLVSQISHSTGGYSTPTGGMGSMIFPDIGNITTNNGSTPVANSNTTAKSPVMAPRSPMLSSSGSFGKTAGGAAPTDAQKVRAFALRYKERVWQLHTLRFEKKFLLGVGASRAEREPAFMNIAYKKELLLVPLFPKRTVWLKSYSDLIPHMMFFHRPTRTWLLTLPVGRVDSTTTGGTVSKTKKEKEKKKKEETEDEEVNPHLLQFRLDVARRKVIWKRLVPMPEHMKGYRWIYYDDLRDVLIGYKYNNTDKSCYKIGYLPDMGKLLTVPEKTPQAKNTRTAKERQEEQRKSQIISHALIKKLSLIDSEKEEEVNKTETVTPQSKQNSQKSQTKNRPTTNKEKVVTSKSKTTTNTPTTTTTNNKTKSTKESTNKTTTKKNTTNTNTPTNTTTKDNKNKVKTGKN